jgi:hypothetical protein
MKDTCDIEMINSSLKKLKYNLKVKPDGNGTEFTWLCAKDNSYTLKVPTSFMLKFEEVLKKKDDHEEEELKEELQGLFSYDFVKVLMNDAMPDFTFHQKLGFWSKDYAEFAIEYEPIKQMELEHAEFKVGEMRVTVSPCSSLFYLLITQFTDDEYSIGAHYNPHDLSDIFTMSRWGGVENARKVHSYTIKLKKTSINATVSFDDLQNDLYSALYYLSVLFPSRYNELPKIANPLSEVELENDEPYVNLNPDTSISVKSVPKPTHPSALRYFYHADHLVLQGVGQEAVLYYYKVLEHFF